MINVRVKLVMGGREYWTSPIKNPVALAVLRDNLTKTGIGFEMFDDDEHGFVAAGCFEIARQRGGGIRDFTWGRRGKQTFHCEIAGVPKAAGLLDEQLNATCGGKEETPRELRGPTDEEVAQHTPSAVMAFEHGGGRSGRPTLAGFDEKLAARRMTWLDRLLAWALGTSKGSEVRK